FSMVGMADKAVEESKDRFSAAIKNSGFKSPKQRNQKVVVSLAPAQVKKEGPSFDLGIALAYLLASKEIKFDPAKKLFLGELSLDGSLRAVTGMLPLAIEAKKRGYDELYVPKDNALEAALIEGITVFPVTDLKEIVEHFGGKVGEPKIENTIKETEEIASTRQISPQPKTVLRKKSIPSLIDFSDVRGQESAKRGLEIAAAGGHNIAMYGPPGTGKTMLAKAFCHILPALSFEDMLEVTGIHSIAGALRGGLVTEAPFRSPHHTSSYVALVGGGASPKPGEITLAHKGVLFLDEFPEFDRKVIDSLRQPLEDRVVSVSRAKGSVLFPAHFILIATMNPCPCGNYGIKGKECVCSALSSQRYQLKISGPIVDRIDIWLEVGSVSHADLARKDKTGETTEIIRKRVLEARTIQGNRFKKAGKNIKTNAEMSAKQIEELIDLDLETTKILTTSAEKLDLSARAYHKIIKLARTIADLDKSPHVLTPHILEALQYRPRKR
ncbi:ATP-binding protein, partial [Patescibacteria group bacterium]